MKHYKKNQQHLISAIQTASYLLLNINDCNNANSNQMKKDFNNTLNYLKQDIKKLKRV